MSVPLMAGADVERLGLVPRIPALLGRLVAEVRALTGFDRVMAYRFRQLCPERPNMRHLERWYASLQQRKAFQEHVEAIRADLAWLGLHPEREERQSAALRLPVRRWPGCRGR